MTQKSCLPFLLGFVLAGFPLCVYIIRDVEYAGMVVPIGEETRESEKLNQLNSLQKVRIMKSADDENSNSYTASDDMIPENETKEMSQQKVRIMKSDNDENSYTTSKDMASEDEPSFIQSTNTNTHSDEEHKMLSTEKIEEKKITGKGSYLKGKSYKSGWVPASVTEYHIEQNSCIGGTKLTHGEADLAQIRKQVKENMAFPKVRVKSRTVGNCYYIYYIF